MAKKRTAAQKRATAKLVAFNKSRRAGKKKTKRRANPIVALPNPTKRRKRRAASVSRASVRRRRRNPIKIDALKSVIMPAAVQAGGGLAINLLMSYVTPYLPAQLKTGVAKDAVTLAAAVGLAMFGGKFISRGMAKDLAQGAATITLYNLAKSSVTQMAPAIGSRLAGWGDMDYTVEGLGYYSNALTFDEPGIGELYAGQGMGELYAGQGMGEYNVQQNDIYDDF